MANVSFYLGSNFAADKAQGGIYFDKAQHKIWVGDNLIIDASNMATAGEVASDIATAKQEAIDAAATAAQAKITALNSTVSAGALSTAGSTIAGVQVLTGITEVGGTLASVSDAAADAYGSAQKALDDAKLYADGLTAGMSYADAAVAHQFVTSVSEEDGVISVTRAQATAGDISVENLSTQGISGGDLQTVLGRMESAINAGGVGSVVEVEKLATAETGYAASYIVKQGGTQVGATINIPKDFLVKSAELKTATAGDTAAAGVAEGDKFIDFVVNSKDGDDTASHIYLPVEDLVDVYTAGNGLTLAGGTFSGVVDSNNANGLSVGANGFAMALASTEAAGAMSAADKAKLDGIAAGGEVNVIETVKVNGVALTVTEKSVNIDLSGKVDKVEGKGLSTEDYTTAEQTKLAGIETGAQVNVIESIVVNGVTASPVQKVVSLNVPTALSDLTNDNNFVTDASYVHTDNNFTSDEKTKLAGIEAGAEANIIESISVNGATALAPDANKGVNLVVVESVSGTGAINVTTGPNPVVSIVWEEYN